MLQENKQGAVCKGALSGEGVHALAVAQGKGSHCRLAQERKVKLPHDTHIVSIKVKCSRCSKLCRLCRLPMPCCVAVTSF